MVSATSDTGCRDAKTASLEHFTEEDGLSSDAMHTLVLDSEGMLWVSAPAAAGGLRAEQQKGKLDQPRRQRRPRQRRRRSDHHRRRRLPLARHVAAAFTRTHRPCFCSNTTQSDDAMYAADGGLRSWQYRRRGVRPGVEEQLDSEGAMSVVTFRRAHNDRTT